MRHLRASMHSLLVLTVMMFALQSSPQASAGTITLTAAQCTRLRADLTLYINFIHKYFGSGPLVQKAIAVATADVNKLCPVSSNNFSVDTEFECGVLDSTASAVVSLGLDSSLNLVNVITPAKTACMSSTACSTIVSQKFAVFGANQTARCSDPNDQTVLHLTDTQVQTKINAVP